MDTIFFILNKNIAYHMVIIHYFVIAKVSNTLTNQQVLLIHLDQSITSDLMSHLRSDVYH